MSSSGAPASSGVTWLDVVTAAAAAVAAVAAVLGYRRQTSNDSKVGWRVEVDEQRYVFLNRSGGGEALDVTWTFDGATMLNLYPPTGDAVGPGERIPLGRAAPISRLIAPGRLVVAWKQKRLMRTTTHTWKSRLT